MKRSTALILHEFGKQFKNKFFLAFMPATAASLLLRKYLVEYRDETDIFLNDPGPYLFLPINRPFTGRGT